MQLDRSIFKAYDIRGIVGKSLTEDVVRAVGEVLGTRAVLKGIDTLCVGRDGRLSGPSLAAALIAQSVGIQRPQDDAWRSDAFRT